MDIKNITNLQVIFKTVERCNIACSYCYYFFGGDDTYKKMPTKVSPAIIADVARFLKEGLTHIDLDSLEIVFHGGEPMMQKPSEFDEMCTIFKELINNDILKFGIQTNAMLVNEKWIDLFEKHNVSTGVSMDGPSHYHDVSRVDHKGRGTHKKAEAGFLEIREAARQGKFSYPGILTVIDWKFNYKEIIKYFYEELNARSVGFLLPDLSHDDGLPEGATIEDYSQALCDIFDAWTQTKSLTVREISRVINKFQLAKLPTTEKSKRMRRFYNQVIVIQSDGTISIDDSYMPAKSWRAKAPRHHISNVTLKEHLEHAIFDEISNSYNDMHEKCKNCMWINICNAGDLENRWSTENEFKNPYIYCDALKSFYERIVRYLIDGGYPYESIEERLFGTNRDRGGTIYAA